MLKKLVVLFAILVGVFAFAVPAGAAQSVAPGVVGTYTIHESGGTKLTVGFSPCGHDSFYVDADGNIVTYHDPALQYYAKVASGRSATMEVWAHSTAVLNGALVNLDGFGLTDAAVATLNQDAATYTCTA
jgi:hypothetical protein